MKSTSNLDFQHQFKDYSFIVPIGYLNKTFVKLNDVDLDCLNQYKNIIRIFKEKHIDLKIFSLDRLLEINKLLPDDFSSINFKYFNKSKTEISKYSISDIIDNIDLSNLKFIKISKLTILSPDEFKFWWNVLRSRRTRFNLTSIYLKFSLLSECLTVLSLCSDCPELEYVNLWYWEADAENEHEAVEQAKREFRQKFGFIDELEIS